jgi:hypothetical protein
VEASVDDNEVDQAAVAYPRVELRHSQAPGDDSLAGRKPADQHALHPGQRVAADLIETIKRSSTVLCPLRRRPREYDLTVPAQQSKTDQQMSFRNRWSSNTSSRIASGSRSRCHRHSSRPAASDSLVGAAARAALIA